MWKFLRKSFQENKKKGNWIGTLVFRIRDDAIKAKLYSLVKLVINLTVKWQNLIMKYKVMEE